MHLYRNPATESSPSSGATSPWAALDIGIQLTDGLRVGSEHWVRGSRGSGWERPLPPVCHGTGLGDPVTPTCKAGGAPEQLGPRCLSKQLEALPQALVMPRPLQPSRPSLPLPLTLQVTRRGTWGSCYWKPHLHLLSCWLSSSCYAQQHNSERDCASRLQILRADIVPACLPSALREGKAFTVILRACSGGPGKWMTFLGRGWSDHSWASWR